MSLQLKLILLSVTSSQEFLCKHVQVFWGFFSLEGMDLFKGEVVHTHDYKYSAPYKNKTAVVVGVGNSGCDAAVDLCHVTSPVSTKVFYIEIWQIKHSILKSVSLN